MHQFGISIDNKFKTFTAILLLCTMSMFLMGQTSCNNSVSAVITKLSADLPVLEKQADNIITLVDPAELPLANQISSGVNALLKPVADAVAAYQANPSTSTFQKVVSALDAASADLPGVLTGIQFANPATLTLVTVAIDGIVAVLDIVASQLPQSAFPVVSKTNRGMRMAARPQKKFTGPIPTPDEVRANWNTSVCSLAAAHDRSCPVM
jgi:hypothetical protein